MYVCLCVRMYVYVHVRASEVLSTVKVRVPGVCVLACAYVCVGGAENFRSVKYCESEGTWFCVYVCVFACTYVCVCVHINLTTHVLTSVRVMVLVLCVDVCVFVCACASVIQLFRLSTTVMVKVAVLVWMRVSIAKYNTTALSSCKD